MSRLYVLVFVLSCLLGTSGAFAQSKKLPAAKSPKPTDNSIGVNVYLRDAKKNELLLGTRIWPGYPEYNALALQRYFALMKALEPTYQQDDAVAYTWHEKNRVAKCSVYLESWDAGVKNGTGAIAGCEANGISTIAATSGGDPKRGLSSSEDAKHLADVLEVLKKQTERAGASLAKK